MVIEALILTKITGEIFSYLAKSGTDKIGKKLLGDPKKRAFEEQ